MQLAYEIHRNNRNAFFRNQIHDRGFHEWNEDEILSKVLEANKGLTDFVDARHNLAFWARPPQHVRELITKIQNTIAPLIGPGECYMICNECRETLLTVILGLWLVPQDHLHMTTLEIRSEVTGPEIDELTSSFWQSGIVEGLANYTLTHRARLVRPIISFDTSAIALSFVPAAGETDTSGYSGKDDQYTYHHLRSDLYKIVTQSGCPIAARYTVPSAHITIARFFTPSGPGDRNSKSPTATAEKAKQLIKKVEDLNRELRSNVWRTLGDPSQGEWVVGHEQGLELMKGRTWYGIGDSVVLGEGFV